MMRLTDVYEMSCVLAPASIAAATETASSYVDAKDKSEVAFQIAAASLADGKKLTVGIYAGNAPDGTGAVKVAERVFTASGAMTKVLACVSYKPKAADGRYVGVKIQHDSSAAVICAVTAAAAGMYRPADNSWVMED